MRLYLFGPGGRTWRIIRSVKQIIRQRKLEKKFRIGGGKNIDKHFYVIGVNNYREGLFSIVNQVLRHIEYAVDRNMIPVVNMRDFKSMFYKEGINAWEEFFEQPCNFGLDDIIGSHKVTFSYDNDFPQLNVCRNVSDLKNQDLNKLKDLYKKYIRPNKFMLDYIKANTPNGFNSFTKIGCICRGTDYFNAPIIGISKQPTAKMMIEKVKEYMNKYNIEKVYCATEDKRIYKEFKEEFGNKLIPNTQQMYDKNEGKFLSEINEECNIDIYKINREYFLSLWMVSQCDYFIGGKVSGTNAVILMNNNFKEIYVFKLGVVSKEDLLKYQTIY